jgi:hypothetical protein
MVDILMQVRLLCYRAGFSVDVCVFHSGQYSIPLTAAVLFVVKAQFSLADIRDAVNSIFTVAVQSNMTPLVLVFYLK